MNYNDKLSTVRFFQSEKEGRDFNEEMESDRGRSINSAAVRRLQQKTQVFPLETNAAVRSRLTHSLEVQQTGRYIAKLILKMLDEKVLTTELGLADKRDGFISAVEIACLLHDVGNPPFGHFGEEAINIWARETLSQIFETKFGEKVRKDRRFKDLMTFEGNAQAIRLLHSLQGLNLTYTQVACLIKYTRPAYQAKPGKNSAFCYRQKKPGFYLSEQEYIKKLTAELKMGAGCRFPLTYIMEAADDISYCIADLDDALDKGILDVEQLHKAIENQWQSFKGKDGIQDAVVDKGYLLNITKAAYEKYKKEKYNKSHVYMLKLRTDLVNDLAKYAANRFIDNHQAIFDGTLDEPLLGGNDSYYLASETLKEVAIKRVFCNKEVERLELKGYSVIKGLLQIYTPLLMLTSSDFKELAMSNYFKGKPIETRLFHDMSSKHKRTYLKSVEPLFSKEKLSRGEQKTELYYRSRLIIDYVSGMTDRFSLDEYRDLSASF